MSKVPLCHQPCEVAQIVVWKNVDSPCQNPKELVSATSEVPILVQNKLLELQLQSTIWATSQGQWNDTGLYT